MSSGSPRAPGMPWLSPYLTVKSAEAALDFYQRAFGFEKHSVMQGPDGRLQHVEMAWREAIIMFSSEGASGGSCQAPVSTGVKPSFNLYVYCEDVDALFQRATTAGANPVVPPQDMHWGDRMCQVSDPDGYLWCFATHRGAGANACTTQKA